MRTHVCAGLLVVSMIVAGCGGGDEDAAVNATTAATSPTPTVATVATTAQPAPPPTTGRVGDALYLQEQYELNGQPTTVDLRVRLVKVDADAAAPNEFTRPEKGMRWVRLRVKFTNESPDALQQSVEDISVVTAQDEAFSVEGFPFQPSLGHNVAQLGSGQSRVGFVAAMVPRGVALKEVRMTGSYVEPLVWTIPRR